MTEKQVHGVFQRLLDDPDISSKLQITRWIARARKYETYARQIIQLISVQFQKESHPRQLQILQLVDQMIRTLDNTRYPKLIAPQLPSMFRTVFEKANKEDRRLLYSQRDGWTYFISEKVLREIDRQANSIDPKWPIREAPTIPSGRKRLHPSEDRPARNQKQEKDECTSSTNRQNICRNREQDSVTAAKRPRLDVSHKQRSTSLARMAPRDLDDLSTRDRMHAERTIAARNSPLNAALRESQNEPQASSTGDGKSRWNIQFNMSCVVL